jgi:hypothetical protein
LRLDDGVVVGPGVFEAEGEFVDRLDALGTEEDEAYGCGTEACRYPEEVFHDGPPWSAVVV